MEESMLKKLTYLTIGILTIFCLVNCDTKLDGGENQFIDYSISLNHKEASLVAGDETAATLQLNLSFAPEAPSSYSIKWTSANPAVATVDSSGLVSAVAVGTTKITASVGSQTVSCTITVLSSHIKLQNIFEKGSTILLSIGDSQDILPYVEFNPQDTTQLALTFSSADQTVATINENGIITAVAAGTTEITVSSAYELAETAASTEENLSCAISVEVVEFSSDAEAWFVKGVQNLQKPDGPPDINAAHACFSKSLEADTEYAPSMLGFSMTSLSAILVKDAVRDIAENVMGIENYPDTLPVLFTESWMVEIDNGEYISYFPAIMGASDENSDGLIDPNEYSIQLLRNFLNNGITDSQIDAVLNDIESQLVAAETMLKAVPEDTQITLSLEYFLDDYSLAMMTFSSITFGKAEVQGGIANIQYLKALLYMVRSLNLGAGLDEYVALIEEGTIPTESIFADGFLSGGSSSEADWSEAKNSIESAIDNMLAAYTSILSRGEGSGFSNASDGNIYSEEFGLTWDTVSTNLNFLKKVFTQVKNSLTNSTDAVFPVDVYNYTVEVNDDFGTYTEPDPEAFMSYYNTEGNWPTEAAVNWTAISSAMENGIDENATFEPVTAIGLNFGSFFEQPMNGLAALIELDENGNPLWYTAEAGTDGSFSNFTPASSWSAESAYFICVPDITLNGLLSSNFTAEDLNSVIGEMGFTSVNDGDKVKMYIPDMMQIMGQSSISAHDLVEKGTSFTVGETSYTSKGSSWAYIVSMFTMLDAYEEISLDTAVSFSSIDSNDEFLFKLDAGPGNYTLTMTASSHSYFDLVINEGWTRFNTSAVMDSYGTEISSPYTQDSNLPMLITFIADSAGIDYTLTVTKN